MKPKCGYCGEASKWGYYNIDGQKICDDCGDFVRNATLEPRPRFKPVMRTCNLNKSPEHLAVKPRLLGEVHDPVNDLRMSGARIKFDIVVNIIGVEHKDAPANLIGTHSRLHSLLKSFYCLFGVVHRWCMVRFLNSSTNIAIVDGNGEKVQPLNRRHF
jgi:hypothetical protein